MIYLYPNNSGSLSIFYELEAIPEFLRDKIIEIEALPEGSGVLKQDEFGKLYYESVTNEPTTEPEVPTTPVETLEDKIARMEQQFQEQQQQNLILVDINLTVYEELLNMKDQIAQLTGATDNA